MAEYAQFYFILLSVTQASDRTRQMRGVWDFLLVPRKKTILPIEGRIIAYKKHVSLGR